MFIDFADLPFCRVTGFFCWHRYLKGTSFLHIFFLFLVLVDVNFVLWFTCFEFWFLPHHFFILVKIFYSLKEYEEKAVSLALNRLKLQDLRNRLEASRLTCPLFDTARWVSLP